MEWVEATGRSVTEAKDAALDLLGVAGDEADFEVLAEAEKGLFGRLKTEARVRARVRPAQPRPKAENNRNDRKRGRGRNDNRGRSKERGGGSSSDAPAKKKDGGRGRSDGGRDRPTRDRNARDENNDRNDSDRSSNDQNNRDQDTRDSAEQSGAGRESAPRRTPKADRPAAAAAPSATATAAVDRDDTPRGDEVSLDDQAKVVSDFLDGLAKAFGVSGEVSTIEVDEETLEVQLNGDDLGLLIGPRGNTLRCVQDLARTVVQRQGERAPGRVRVDVAEYYAERRASLERFTREVAQKVIDSGEELALEPMRAADRKVVHDAVGDIDGVDTISEGSDPDRRVVIIPSEA